jgi:hypothetical protein
MKVPRPNVFDRVVPTTAACKSVKGQSIGHGEGFTYLDRDYYYRCGCDIPKDRAVIVASEDDPCGRVRGTREYMVVAWDKDAFVLLDFSPLKGAKEMLAPYIDMTAEQAIAWTKRLYEKRELHRKKQWFCVDCQKLVDMYDFKLRCPADHCYECHSKHPEVYAGFEISPFTDFDIDRKIYQMEKKNEQR